jgi:hypothetical protein
MKMGADARYGRYPRRLRSSRWLFGLIVTVSCLFALLLAQHATERVHAAPNTGIDLIGFVEWSPANPGVGQTLVITYGVENIGSEVKQVGPIVEARLYLGPVTSPTLAATDSHTSDTALFISPGQRRIVAVLDGVLSMPAQNDVPIWVWADPTDQVGEDDDSNNLLRSTINPTSGVVDSLENDDGCTRSRDILPNGGAQLHTIWPAGDQDWVTFAAQSGVTYRIVVSQIGAEAEISFDLHTDCRAPNTMSGTSLLDGAAQWTAAETGPAYVRLRHRQPNHGPNTAYTVSITPGVDCVAYSEPNNTCESSVPIEIGANTTRLGAFCYNGDADWHSFEGKAGLTYSISVNGLGAQSRPYIEQIESHSCGGPPVFSGGQTVSYPMDRDGPVYFRIRNKTSAFGRDTEYSLAVTVAGCSDDVAEPNDALNAAKPLAVNQPYLLNACPPGDEDWFVFAAAPNVAYTLETAPEVGDLADEQHADTRLCLLDESGTQTLACDDDSGPGLGARLQYSTPQAKTVAVRVTQYDPKLAGPPTRYSLVLRTMPCDPDAHEANDGALRATTLISGTPRANTLCPSADQDWFTFTVPPGEYMLTTSDLGKAADTTLALYVDPSAEPVKFNNDHGKTLASRVTFSATTATTYYALVQRASGVVGSGVQYSITLRTYQPDPTIVINPDDILLNPQAVGNNVRTLIITNRAQLERLYGTFEADRVMNALAGLQEHPHVLGDVIDLNRNDTVRAAYDAWNANPTTERANAVAASTRNLILDQIGPRPGIQYLVIAGDDRVVPFHRIPDPSVRFSESTYAHKLASTTVGRALTDNHFLTDDCFSADRLVTAGSNRWCVPRLATGRLVETPADILKMIQTFTQLGRVAPSSALVGGYDFAIDSAGYACERLQAELGNGVNCTLMNDFADLNTQRALQFNTSPPFLLQTFHGHGQHFQLGINLSKQFVTSSEVSLASAPPVGGLVWSPACHLGLNVPPGYAGSDLDFAQAYASHGVNLIANTGYGWGASGVRAFSEQLVEYFVDNLVSGAEVQLGPSLQRAKWKYYLQNRGGGPIDPKIAMEMTLYGLPMYRVATPVAASNRAVASAANTDDDDFPSMVDNDPSFGVTFNGLASTTVSFSFANGAQPTEELNQISLGGSTAYALDGRLSVELGESLQPRFYVPISDAVTSRPARGVWIEAATYQPIHALPVQASAINEFGAVQDPSAEAWDNTDMAFVRSVGGRDMMIVPMGQSNAHRRQTRLTRSMSATVYASNRADSTPPTLDYVSLLRSPDDAATVKVKIKASDAVADVIRAGLLFTDGNGEWHTLDLTHDITNTSWIGSVKIPAGAEVAVQLLDAFGNVARYTNKGRYYAPEVEPASVRRVLTPLIRR